MTQTYTYDELSPEVQDEIQTRFYGGGVDYEGALGMAYDSAARERFHFYARTWESFGLTPADDHDVEYTLCPEGDAVVAYFTNFDIDPLAFLDQITDYGTDTSYDELKMGIRMGIVQHAVVQKHVNMSALVKISVASIPDRDLQAELDDQASRLEAALNAWVTTQENDISDIATTTYEYETSFDSRYDFYKRQGCRFFADGTEYWGDVSYCRDKTAKVV